MGGLASLRQYHFLNAFFLEFLNANFVMPTQSQNLNGYTVFVDRLSMAIVDQFHLTLLHTHNRRDKTLVLSDETKFHNVIHLRRIGQV